MRSKVQRIDPAHPDPIIIQAAADIIHVGGLVAFPTETVYGLGTDAMNPDAIRRIYQAKGRTWRKPLLVLIADVAWLEELTAVIPDAARSLMDAFWPGPLTLTVPAASSVPRELLGPGTTIGIRFPGPSIAQTLTRTVGRSITAPSANRSGTPNPLSAEDVAASIGRDVDLIVDGGPATGEIPSTVVDVTTLPPTLIRPGCVPFDDILRVWRSHAG